MHHCGITVSDLDRAISFYVDLLGAEMVSRRDGVGSEHASAALGLDGVLLNTATLSFPGGGLLELVRYDEPAGRTVESRTCDVGSTHLSFIVPDIRSIYAWLGEKGAKITSDPRCLDLRSSTGEFVTLFARDLDGTHIEFMQPVSGKA